MRLRLVEVEGTPEEIRRLDIEQLLGRPFSPSQSLMEADTDPAGFDEARLSTILEAEAPPGRTRELLEAFFDTVRSWGDVSVVPNWRANAPGRVSYLRVHRHPRTRGAFVYVFPARLRLNFRLDAAEAKGATHAAAREVKRDNAYQVSISLTDQSTLEEALRLSRRAYELVGA
ncbi:MAG TPA: hypothetical protein VMY88_07380 [Acidimicrobiales bacterium]|nr:hypothetical protein [Acidimicrobiales bacterium]